MNYPDHLASICLRRGGSNGGSGGGAGGQLFEVCEDAFEDLLGDPGCLDPGCEALFELLSGVDVVAEVPDLVGVLGDILAQDTTRPRDGDQLRQAPLIQWLRLALQHGRRRGPEELGSVTHRNFG
ncbi:hypothetical protein U6T76_12760, partial [Cutibacterium acnes]